MSRFRDRSIENHRRLRIAAALVAVVAITSVSIAYAAEELKKRTLIIFAVNANDEYVYEQFRMLACVPDGLAERDMVIEKLLGKDLRSAELRRKFHISGEFHVLLIGKDGHVAASSDYPMVPEELFRIVDAMPMRQEEMRHALSTRSSK